MWKTNNLNSVLLIAKYNLIRNLTNPRIYILFILVFIQLWYLLHPFSATSVDLNLKISPWIYPHISSDSITKFFLMFGLMVFFIDTPFVDDNYKFIVLRSGRKKWIVGQVLYIILGTTVYFCIVYLLSIIILLPNMFFTTGWGKFFKALSMTSGGDISVLKISGRIINLYTPINATIISLSLDIILGISLILIMFTFSLANKKRIGMVCISIIMLMDLGMSAISCDTIIMSHCSPLSISKLSNLEIAKISGMPTLSYAYLALGIPLVVLLAITLIYGKKIYIEKMEQQ